MLETDYVMTREEALKKVRQMSLPKETMEILEALIPELKESEDERIRKVIVKYFKELHVESWINLEIPNILAWLEKQKEANKAIEAVERIDKYIDEHVENAHDMKDSHPDKKYCQGIDDTLTGIAWILQDVYSNEKQKEQKPAEWSEEDEKIRKTLLDYYEKALDNYTCVEWLNGITYGELCDWLKSLRPSWKPSEEQMKALLNAEGFLRAGLQHDSAKTIAELYEQLKKLM